MNKLEDITKRLYTRLFTREIVAEIKDSTVAYLRRFEHEPRRISYNQTNWIKLNLRPVCLLTLVDEKGKIFKAYSDDKNEKLPGGMHPVRISRFICGDSIYRSHDGYTTRYHKIKDK